MFYHLLMFYRYIQVPQIFMCTVLYIDAFCTDHNVTYCFIKISHYFNCSVLSYFIHVFILRIRCLNLMSSMYYTLAHNLQ